MNKHKFNIGNFFYIKILGPLLIGAIALAFGECGYEAPDEAPEFRTATEIALAWNDLALELERHTQGYRPPVSARMFAYLEMAAYESSLPALHDYISLERYVNGYKALPYTASEYYLPAGLNAAYAEMLRHFFPTAPYQFLQKIDQLEKASATDLLKNTTQQTLDHSAGYGRDVALAVWEWSKTDREGNEAYLYNYDHNFEPPMCEGCWKPTGEHPSPALLPFWGKVRPFIVAPEEINFKSPIAYDAVPGSDFHTEAMEVYSVSKPLSRENTWIAEFWSDDFQGLTVTPSGRWISIANQAFRKSKAPFPLVMETYVKTSMALSDVSVVVWRIKYTYNVERPETYIHKWINPGWKPLHDSPSFPAYPSGHSAFGAAAAEVLTVALGDHFELTDRTHEHRPEFASNPRTYGSFAEMAKENAASRVLLGVHYRMDCEEGMRLGKIVGQKIAALPLLRKEARLLH